jgi:hypothetical protein
MLRECGTKVSRPKEHAREFFVLQLSDQAKRINPRSTHELEGICSTASFGKIGSLEETTSKLSTISPVTPV